VGISHYGNRHYLGFPPSRNFPAAISTWGLCHQGIPGLRADRFPPPSTSRCSDCKNSPQKRVHLAQSHRRFDCGDRGGAAGREGRQIKAYWDSSALVQACIDEKIRTTLSLEGGVTRLHSFAEVFSTLTGGRLGFRSRAEDASKICRELAAAIRVVELDTETMLEALANSRCHGVRGGMVYDFLHAVTAQKAGAEKIYTLNLDDFFGLRMHLEIMPPPSS
jgi:predicted nucleic acid-binding protein